MNTPRPARRRWPLWVRNIPTAVVIVWASVSTWLVVHNYNASNTISRARVSAICTADNETRALTAQILATGASGTDSAAVRWQALQLRLAPLLVATDCVVATR